MTSVFRSRVILMLSVLLLSACAGQYRPVNTELPESRAGEELSLIRGQRPGGNPDVQVFLAFSGGGTRASALSYGVLSELRETQYKAAHTTYSLLDEVDAISSVSGGSFTAAYYGLYGDRIFDDYEEKFLKHEVQSTLIKRLFNPYNWWRSITTQFDRNEIAVEYYDQTIFSGATMGDLRDAEGPSIIINSTDLTTGNRFSFDQATFDLICSDINDYPVSRAVTASSAVPVLFNPVVLNNFAGQCDTGTHELLDNLLARDDLNLRQSHLLNNVSTLRDSQQRPFIHLVDGGISDNLGLRALVDWTDILGTSGVTTQLIGGEVKRPRHVALILVNAALTPERTMDSSADAPSSTDVLTAISDSQMLRYTLETQMLIQELAANAEAHFQENGVPIYIHVSLLSFKDVQDEVLFQRLNAIQTTLELPEDQVDELINSGRLLLRENEEFQQFLQAIDQTAVSTGS
ncbi:MAG: patatin-like phospholipase family protein [Halioglobus sp.]